MKEMKAYMFVFLCSLCFVLE